MNRKLAETLDKVIAAVGWADQQLSSEEIENLKDLLFQFQRSVIDPREDAIYDMYLKSPVEEAERERLIKELRETIWSPEDKTFVLAALKRTVEADGTITDDEQAVLNKINTTIESIDTGVLGDLRRLINAAMRRRSQAIRNAPNREKYLEDFLVNKVYYEVRRRLELSKLDLPIPDQELRKLSIVGGWMAHVARTDHIMLADERNKIK